MRLAKATSEYLLTVQNVTGEHPKEIYLPAHA